MAKVVSLKITRHEINSKDLPELQYLFRLDALPLANAEWQLTLNNISVAAVNGLRRALTDEILGQALQVLPGGFNVELTTDRFMLPQFVLRRLSCIRLRPQISAEIIANLRLKLDITNQGATPYSVYTGDLEVVEGSLSEPIFNPTTRLAVLQPGKRIVINDIYISTGYGRENGIYNVACRTAFTHLDIEQYTDAEMRNEDGVAADQSGYKTSSLMANPKKHILTGIIPATSSNLAETRAVLEDACMSIKERLKLIATAVERRDELPSGGFAHRGVQYTVVKLETGLSEGILQVPGESHTIGELIRRTAYDLTPDIANVAYTIVSHENRLSITIRHTEDVTRILMNAINFAINTFDNLQRGINSARI